MGHQLAFCTLGMFIIDEIEYLDDKAPELQVIGGAGTYAALGARLVAGQTNAASVGWIVDAGSDFPPTFRSLLDSWQTSCLFREDTTRLTTRSWNGYGLDEHRDFKYLTPKVRLDEESLSATQLLSKAFHMVCSPARCRSLVTGINQKRTRQTLNYQPPSYVWEPVSGLCVPEQLPRLKETVRLVNVVSPNAEELGAFFADRDKAMTEIEMIDEILRDSSPAGDGPAIIVRQGGKGCIVHSQGRCIHLRPYHMAAQSSPSKVVDPTGGGNTFLGAIAYGLGGVASRQTVQESLFSKEKGWNGSQLPASFRELLVASVYATVAASFAIEQVGVPVLSDNSSGSLWNGESFESRVVIYLRREQSYIAQQLMSNGHSNPA